MTSAWIAELEDIYADGGDWDDYYRVLRRINGLLRVAMLSVEDEDLHDQIKEELEEV